MSMQRNPLVDLAEELQGPYAASVRDRYESRLNAIARTATAKAQDLPKEEQVAQDALDRAITMAKGILAPASFKPVSR